MESQNHKLFYGRAGVGWNGSGRSIVLNDLASPKMIMNMYFNFFRFFNVVCLNVVEATNIWLIIGTLFASLTRNDQAYRSREACSSQHHWRLIEAPPTFPETLRISWSLRSFFNNKNDIILIYIEHIVRDSWEKDSSCQNEQNITVLEVFFGFRITIIFGSIWKKRKSIYLNVNGSYLFLFYYFMFDQLNKTILFENNFCIEFKALSSFQSRLKSIEFKASSFFKQIYYETLIIFEGHIRYYYYLKVIFVCMCSNWKIQHQSGV